MGETHCVIGSDIRIENPSEELLAYCKSNLVLPNPDYAKKVRMSLWTGNTPEKLYLYERDGNELILPYGCLRDIWEMIRGAEIGNRFTGQKRLDFKASVPLYDYQLTAVDEMYRAKGGILQAPAGSGKTQMGIALIARLGVKALWLTHTHDLLMQSYDRAKLYMDESLLGKTTEGKVDIGRGITFATVQTMANLDLARYKDTWDCIVCDECHRICGTPTAVTMFSKVLNSLAARYKYGLSATVHRADGMIRATYALIGRVMYTVPKEAVADRIMQVGIQPVRTGVGISRECLNSDGTLQYARLINYLCGHAGRNQVILQQLRNNRRYSSLILSDRLDHLRGLLNALPADMRKDAVMIDGKMTSKKAKEERDRAIEDMRAGRKKYLFATYSLAKEGLDVPRLERLYLTTPQKDYAVVTQSIGRIARTCEGKADPVALDFVDDAGYLVKAFKKRCTSYRKNGCYFLEDL